MVLFQNKRSSNYLKESHGNGGVLCCRSAKRFFTQEIHTWYISGKLKRTMVHLHFLLSPQHYQRFYPNIQDLHFSLLNITKNLWILPEYPSSYNSSLYSPCNLLSVQKGLSVGSIVSKLVLGLIWAMNVSLVWLCFICIKTYQEVVEFSQRHPRTYSVMSHMLIIICLEALTFQYTKIIQSFALT